MELILQKNGGISAQAKQKKNAATFHQTCDTDDPFRNYLWFGWEMMRMNQQKKKIHTQSSTPTIIMGEGESECDRKIFKS